MAKSTRFVKPLTATSPRASFAITSGMGRCIREMAEVRGISVAEILRRMVAAAIVADGPEMLERLGRLAREELEDLAHLYGNHGGSS